MHTTNVMFLGSRDVVKLGVRTSRCTYIIEVAYGDTLFELMYVGGGDRVPLLKTWGCHIICGKYS